MPDYDKVFLPEKYNLDTSTIFYYQDFLAISDNCDDVSVSSSAITVDLLDKDYRFLQKKIITKNEELTYITACGDGFKTTFTHDITAHPNFAFNFAISILVAFVLWYLPLKLFKLSYRRVG